MIQSGICDSFELLKIIYPLLLAFFTTQTHNMHRRCRLVLVLLSSLFLAATMALTNDKERICIIGSGNWGSAIATVLGRNALRLPFCHNEVRMWVFEEQVLLKGEKEPSKLSDVINSLHENVKYLPGVIVSISLAKKLPVPVPFFLYGISHSHYL